ncbi:MAG: alpha/beta fold hydrolase [Patescibacteria group bacterium]
MKNSIIIHGTCGQEEYFSDKYPSLSNSHWLPWLQKQLLINDIFTQTPEMPEAYRPDYEKWSREFIRLEVNENTVLVGHSCGGGFLLRWLSENKIKIKKLILVAPWLDPRRDKTISFFDFEIDQNIKERIGEIHLLVSKDDEADILESVAIIKNSIADITYHEFINHGHFCFNDMKTDKFPELLSYILE